MTQTDQEFHDEVHYAFVAITLRMGKRSFNQQKRALEAWLAKYVPQAHARGLTEAEHIMRRNVAEWLLTEAAETGRPARAFEPLLRDLEALGWEGLDAKARKIGAMCCYFARRMWNRVGLGYLVPVRREVAQEYARTGDKKWAFYLRWLEDIEQDLRARSRPF